MNADDLDYHHPRTRPVELSLEHPPRSSRRRSSSAGRQSALQIRTSNLVKKLGILTSKLGPGSRFKPNSDSDGRADTPLTENYPYRKARSMDMLRSKPDTSSSMLAMGLDSIHLARSSADGSQESGSDCEIRPAHAVKLYDNSNPNSVAQGLAVSTMAGGAGLRANASVTNSGKHSASDVRAVISADLSNSANNAIQGNKANVMTETLGSPISPPEKRPGHPRLSTLPPLTFHLKGASQQDLNSLPQRFSPSVVVRPPPFPILELPPLPTPTAETPASGNQAQSRPRRGGARLNSMPMLPMEGADERENDPDHEHCVLDEDEDEEGDDDEENDQDGAGSNDAAGSEDEDEEGATNGRSSSSPNTSSAPAAGFFSQTRTLSTRLTLPALNTPSLSSLLSGIGGSSSNSSNPLSAESAGITAGNASHTIRTGSASGNAETIKASRELTTPKAMRTNQNWAAMGNGSSQKDYFPTSGSGYPGLIQRSSQDIDGTTNMSSHVSRPPPVSSASTSTSSSLRTPTARDYSGSRIPMISVAPPPIHTETAVSGTRQWALKDNSFTSESLGSGVSAAVPHLGVKGGLKRPSIYHHASKSMIELISVDTQSKLQAADENEAGYGAGSDRDVKGKGKLSTESSVMKLYPSEVQKVEHTQRISGKDGNAKKIQEKPLPTSPTTALSSSNEIASSLRRQRSMPTFSVSGPPPPYPSFSPQDHLRRFAPLPREDEGIEQLPPYSNDIRLAAVMPRKVEFITPGVPARDRKWRRVHCVLEGTAFRVYDAPPRITGVSALGGWWEKKVGVGDVASGHGAVTGATASLGATTNIVIGRKEPKRRMKWEEELQAEEDAQRAESGTEEAEPRVSTSSANVNIGAERPRASKSKLNIAASLLHPHRSKHSFAHAQVSTSSPASPRSSFQSPRTSAESSTPPSARPSVDLSASASSSSALSSAAVSSNSASSTSLSALSSSSSTSSSHAHGRRRGHRRSDSEQSSISHSRSNSRTQSPLNPDSRSRTQTSNSVSNLNNHSPLNPYLYHPADNTELLEPDEKDLLRVYSLQNAESGLASDYLKRKNVVRVRMEGEQFLLQCKDVASVVEWIEALQAATNIALDLDERPMPKGPIFPRRRRRRRVQPDGSRSGQAASSDTGAGTVPGSERPAATVS